MSLCNCWHVELHCSSSSHDCEYGWETCCLSIDPLPIASVLHGIHVLKRDLHVEPLHADDEVCAKFCGKCHARCSRVGKHVAHNCAEHKSSQSKRIDTQRAKNPMFKSDGFRRTSRNTASPRKSMENPQRSKLWCHSLTITTRIEEVSTQGKAA
jgi:hypothetical protein